MRNVISLVLGGGRGTRLLPLTRYRSKPAVPLGGKYRLIDIPLSNCINSGLNQIYVLTQFMSVSLHRHIRRTYQFDHFSGGFVEILAAQQTMESGTDWFQGTADAVRKNARYLDVPGIDHVLILSGDQLYRMDYQAMMRTHVQSGADVTIAALPVDRAAARSLGVMKVNEQGRVTGFLEKPQTDQETELVRMDPAWIDQQGVESRGRDCLASMGIYLFNRDTLLDVLDKTSYHDFGKEIFPAAIRSRHVQVHLFDGYWEDIGTIRAFYDANLALAERQPLFDLVSASDPVYSRARFLPPSRMDGATVRGSLIADGCNLGENVTIEGSVIGLRCTIGSGTTIRNSILMGADAYESESSKVQNQSLQQPNIGIGEGCFIEGAIIDKNCRIGNRVRISNLHGTTESPGSDSLGADAQAASPCVIREGIPVVTKGAVLPDGWSCESDSA